MTKEYRALARDIAGLRPGADMRDCAVIHWLKGSNDAVEATRYITSDFNKEGRLVLVRGDMRGDGVVTGVAEIDGANIASRGMHHHGRQTRSFALSKVMTDEERKDPAVRLASAEKLAAQARRIIDKVCPGAKYILAVHGDTDALHAQPVFENYNPATGKRLELSRYFCSKLQGPGDWWVEFQPGKGKGQSKVRVSSKRKANLEELKRILSEGKTVADLQNEDRLTLRLHNRRGNLLQKPTLKFDGITARFDSLTGFGFPDLADRFKAVADAAKPRNRAQSGSESGGGGGADGMDRSDDKQVEALRKLREELEKMELEQLIRSRRLRLNLHSKSGRELRRPSIQFDGVRVRFSRFEELGFPSLAGMLRGVKPAPEAEIKKGDEPQKRRGLPLIQQHNILSELAKSTAKAKAKSLARQAANAAFGPAGGMVFDIADFASRMAKKRAAMAQKVANTGKPKQKKNDVREM